MKAIAGADEVVRIFGRWPSFHDAEVLRFCVTRAPEDVGPSIEADLHVFEITDEVAPSAFLVLKHHTLVTFRFVGVTQFRMDGINNQNALMGLAIEDIRGRQLEGIRYEVTFDPSFGLSAGFLCRDVAVIAVRPWEAESGGLNMSSDG
jgi:hypothetical protein